MTTKHDERDGAEIIDFGVFLKKEGVEPKMRIKRRPAGCISYFFEFDEHERTVECPKCGRQWDAFDALAHLARNWTNFAFNRQHLRDEVKELGEASDKLRKEVANLKAAKRRADDVVTALLAALSKRREVAKTAPKDRREFAAGFDAGTRAVVDFIKSDAWRSGGTPGEKA